MVVLIHAHPFVRRSTANRTLLAAIEDLHGLEVRDLYARYPDFSIDVRAEQAALEAADALVIQHPIYWYAAPALLKLWMEEVLEYGWAYAEGGDRLRGKPFLWATTTGGGADDYRPGGGHDRPFDDYMWPMLQTVRYCGMVWQEPFVVHDAHRLSHAALEQHAARYRSLVDALIRGNA